MRRRSGGGSSISLGWDEAPVSAPRPRTRARTPPGGASSINLGWGNEPSNNHRAKTPPPARYQDKENNAAGRSGYSRQEAMSHWQQESSNNYACGNQQNIGNVITGRPTTRVSEIPGGASNFSLGWDDGKAPVPRTQGHALWQREVNCKTDPEPDAGFLQSTIDSRQNRQNFGTAGRPTTRVSANPGGVSTLNLGWEGYTLPQGNATFRRDAVPPHLPAMHSYAGEGYGEERFPADDRVDFQRGAGINPMEDSPRDQRGRSLHHLRKEEPRGVSLPDSDSEVEQSHFEGGAEHAAATRSAGHVASIAAGNGVAFGQRPRESANSFASGRQQNVGNYLTDRPTTRVAANPGGASSLRLGWDDDSFSTPRQGNTTPRSAARGGQHRAGKEDGPDASVIHPSQRRDAKDAESQFDGNALKSLKARMAKKQQSTTPRGSDVRTGGGSDACWDSLTSVSSQGRDKAEVAGSKPRVWKPALAPQAPPGGAESYSCSYDSRFDGRGRVDGAGGAGLNRDNNALHALRYYQDDRRMGKHHVSEAGHQPDKQHRDSHRYFLEEQGQSEHKPGKARYPLNVGNDGSRQSLLAWQAEAPLPGRSNASRRQRTPPPEVAPFEEPVMHNGWRNHQVARCDDIETDMYPEEFVTDMDSTL